MVRFPERIPICLGVDLFQADRLIFDFVRVKDVKVTKQRKSWQSVLSMDKATRPEYGFNPDHAARGFVKTKRLSSRPRST